MVIDCGFPGGNIILQDVCGDEVFLRQDRRDTDVWWFWWCFRVGGSEGREVWFRFTDGDVIGARGPAVSEDGGETWRWLGTEWVDGTGFRYRLPDNGESVRFAFAFPYVETNLRRFLAGHARSESIEVSSLCRTRKGRSVELLRLGRLDGRCAYRVLLTCRHHACESMASFALEGLMGAVLGAGEEGAWLREHVGFLAVPFVDKDGVESGDQGKCRRPRDHNRDYLGASVWETTAAIRELVPRWSEGKLRLHLDLHCPWIKGGNNEWVYCVGHESPREAEELRGFSELLERVCSGPIPYRAAGNLAFGEGWNTGVEQGKSSTNWSAELPGVRLATTVEIPYANASGIEVSAETARALGRDLARAVIEWLPSGG